MRGLNIFEQAHVVNLLPPVDATGGLRSDIFNMRNHRWANIVVMLGASAAAATRIIVNACSDNAGTGREAIPYTLYAEETAGGDTFGAQQAVLAAGYEPSANDNIMYGIFLDAATLPDDKPWVEVEIVNGTNSVLASIVVFLTGSGYVGSNTGRSVLS